MDNEGKIFKPDYSWMPNIPEDNLLRNPIIGIPEHLKESDELTEFLKLSAPTYSPAFGIKYIMNVKLLDHQLSMILAMLRFKFPMLLLSRGAGKTMMLAIYAVYHAVMFPGTRIILVSASFRQAKLIFNEIKAIYDKAPILRQLANYEPRIGNDSCRFQVCGSTITALPLGKGDKIRGERGHVILADEFDSIDPEIFDTVIRGFGATQSDPWQKAKDAFVTPEDENRVAGAVSEGNKIILAGTAGYTNGTFYRHYKHYSAIIANKLLGSADSFKDVLGQDIEKYDVDFRDYCIVRYKWTDLPKGMMDDKLIEGAKATMPRQIFDMEYNATFGDDSLGFFKAKDIREATSSGDGGFEVSSKGLAGRRYVMGVDPARTTDRFSISVVEAGNPTKVVYHWTCQGEKFSHSASKIRQLMRDFNIVGINMDAGGGGYAVEELLNVTKTPEGLEIRKEDEKVILRIDEDTIHGLDPEKCDRILNLQNFTSAWIEEANASLQKNIEDRSLMFPKTYVESGSASLEDIVFEISEMKKELLSIGITYTKSGKKSFDLKPGDSRKDDSVKHKDRYSSLLLSNHMSNNLDDMLLYGPARAAKAYNDDDTLGGWVEEFGN
jgi:hypothetical protein